MSTSAKKKENSCAPLSRQRTRRIQGELVGWIESVHNVQRNQLMEGVTMRPTWVTTETDLRIYRPASRPYYILTPFLLLD